MDPKVWKKIQNRGRKHEGHKPPTIYPADPEYALGDQLTRASIPYEREVKIYLNSHGCNYAKVDFLIQGWLVVEIDGPSHLSKDQKDFDMRKSLALLDKGYRVLRVKPEAVLGSKALRLIQTKMVPHRNERRVRYLLKT